jgi:AcrR family transcriptional regulator
MRTVTRSYRSGRGYRDGVGETQQAATGRTPRSEATRTRIVEAALRLFAEHGYARTTMRAIAGEAGVSVGNAYY